MIKLVQQTFKHLLNARPVLSAEEDSTELLGSGYKAQWKCSRRPGPCPAVLSSLPSGCGATSSDPGEAPEAQVGDGGCRKQGLPHSKGPLTTGF